MREGHPDRSAIRLDQPNLNPNVGVGQRSLHAMMEEDLGWYATTEDGLPICPTGNAEAESVSVVSESTVGYGNQSGVSGQGYRFYPCEHTAAYDLPMGGV
jgi:hypothetical protein